MSGPPPHNLEAELAVLGAMMLSSAALDDVLLELTERDFYKPSHRTLFTRMVELTQKGEACDPLTLSNYLTNTGELDEIGGSKELVSIQSSTPSISNASAYAKIVKNASTLRKLIGIGHDITDAGFDAGSDADQVVRKAEEAIYKIASTSPDATTITSHVALRQMMDAMSESWMSPDGMVGVPTGFQDIDNKLSGLRSSALFVLGARPGMGKSALASNIATNIAVDQGLPVIFFNLEMKADEVMQRMLSARSKVTLNNQDGDLRLSRQDWLRVANAANEIANAPLLIDSDPVAKPMDIHSRSRKAMSKYGKLGLIVVDYLQLMLGDGSSESRQLEVAEISRGLKVLSNDLDVPVLALSQLSRRLESRENKRPMLSDLRESGALEQDADVVMFLYRDSEYNEDAIEQGLVELIVAKHRQGGRGTVKLGFIGQQTRFASVATGL